MFWSRGKPEFKTSATLRSAKGIIKVSFTQESALEILTRSQGEWCPTVLTTGRGTHRYDKTWKFTGGYSFRIREAGIEVSLMPGDLLVWDENRVAVLKSGPKALVTA